MDLENQTDSSTENTGAGYGSATYCPEDNKLRLYVGRVPRADYERLRADGWTSTPKQSCDFVAVWTPERRDLCLEWCGTIDDEDASPEERAADRAERFAGYREKRTAEACGHADRYEGQPQVYGFQSQARAERAAARFDRVAARACDSWSKAEYWQRRTAGVISHALYKSTPAVRMGRIKEIEAAIRKAEKSRAEYAERRQAWIDCAAMTDTEKQNATAFRLAYFEQGDFTHPRTGRKTYLYALCKPDAEKNPDPLNGAEICALWLADNGPLAPEGDWLTHNRMRLAYENQMLEAAGGRAAFVEMQVGGWIGRHQIRKVNKSNETGRVVSVTLKIPGDRWGNSQTGFHLRPFNVERLSVDAYRPPTPEDIAALEAEKKAEKAAAPKKAPCPLINPTDADAERLQGLINERHRIEHEKAKAARQIFSDFEPASVVRITQAVYSANSQGAFAKVETRTVHRSGQLSERDSNMYDRARNERDAARGVALAQVRTARGGKCRGWSFEAVVVLTDKPQKPFPAAVWPEDSITSGTGDWQAKHAAAVERAKAYESA